MQCRTIGIIGYGQFGQFIEKLFTIYAPHIEVKKRDIHPSIDTLTPLETVCEADVVFLSVPIKALQQTLITIRPLIHQQTVLVEVSTVKEAPVERLQPLREECYFLATHPMFGPYSYQKKGSLQNLRLVICDHNLPEHDYTSVRNLLQLLQLTVIELSAKQHDILLAESLFLTHYLTQTLLKAGMVRTEIDTVSFGNLMDVVESVKNDTALFQDVRRYNTYCKDMLIKRHDAQKHIEDLLLKETPPLI